MSILSRKWFWIPTTFHSQKQISYTILLQNHLYCRPISIVFQITNLDHQDVLLPSLTIFKPFVFAGCKHHTFTIQKSFKISAKSNHSRSLGISFHIYRWYLNQNVYSKWYKLTYSTEIYMKGCLISIGISHIAMVGVDHACSFLVVSNILHIIKDNWKLKWKYDVFDIVWNL